MPVLAALALLPLLQSSPVSGTFVPANGAPVQWEINANRTLQWGGSSYMPVGLRIEGTLDAVEKANTAGIKDVLVQLPVAADWSPIVAALEAKGMRYMMTVDSVAPAAKGYVVDPQRYRLPDHPGSDPISLELPGVKAAYAVAVSNRDNEIEWSGRIEATDGRLNGQMSLNEDFKYTVFIFPETASVSQIDAWEEFDQQRDQLLATLRKAKFGPGFRGLLNPAGETLTLRPTAERVIPTNSYFRLELKQFLEAKYRNIQTALKAWNVGTNTIADFDEFSRLVPLWNGTRGVMHFWDPVQNVTYRATSRNSSAWQDLQSVIDQAMARRFDRLVRAIHQVVDVPVVQDWRGWASPYESRDSALTGVAARVQGTSPSELADEASRSASSVMRWPGTGWIMASEIDPTGTAEVRPDMIVADLANMGHRAFFFRTQNPAVIQAIAQTTAEPNLATYTTTPLFYPENASNPAAPQRLPGGFFWFPSPQSGNTIDLGGTFNAYRYGDPAKPFTAIWTTSGTGRIKIRLTEPQKVTFTTLDGTDPKPKTLKNGVELTLGELPVLMMGTDEIPVPELSFNETVLKFDNLAKWAQKRNRPTEQEFYTFKDAARGFDRNPGGSFGVMRLNFWRLTQKMAPYQWIEAELTRQQNFSEAVSLSGAANGAVLALRSLEGQVFRADYTFFPKSEEQLEVWVAGRIPKESRGSVRVLVSNQQLELDPTPVSGYGQGLQWFRAGSTRLAGTKATVTLEVLGDRPHDLVIDAIMLAPANYLPRGPFPPEMVLTP